MASTLYTGKMQDVLAALEAESTDSVVCDPPYELGFMGKSWDSSGVAFQKETWDACYRVLKPGGYLLAFGGDRTIHRIMVAIEDAGFEIRTQLVWLHGQGFPKSMDVSKAIDKAAGIAGEWREHPQYANHNGGGSKSIYGQNSGMEGKRHLYSPATPEAKQWQGWGTAIKPAMELICMARKPLAEKTVVRNVLKYGTGAINVDACRIDAAGEEAAERNHHGAVYEGVADGYKRPGKSAYTHKTDWKMQPQGRWPANLVLDEEAAEMLDNQTGYLAGGAFPAVRNAQGFKSDGLVQGETGQARAMDGGGASRFFYVAKASKAERSRGLYGADKSKRDVTRNADQPSMNGGEGNPYNRGAKEVVNSHPTVKPVALMRWLVRMVTRPGGTCLDPFMGSGTTGVACAEEHITFIGCDMTPEYVEIARQRIEYAEQTPMQNPLGL